MLSLKISGDLKRFPICWDSWNKPVVIGTVITMHGRILRVLMLLSMINEIKNDLKQDDRLNINIFSLKLCNTTIENKNKVIIQLGNKNERGKFMDSTINSKNKELGFNSNLDDEEKKLEQHYKFHVDVLKIFKEYLKELKIISPLEKDLIAILQDNIGKYL